VEPPADLRVAIDGAGIYRASELQMLRDIMSKTQHSDTLANVDSLRSVLREMSLATYVALRPPSPSAYANKLN
jgi:hypothetical protein